MLVPVDGAGDVELVPGDGAGDEVVGTGLVVGDGLFVGDGLLVAAGVADGDVVGELAADAGTVGVATGIGSVAPAELGNNVITGSVAAALCFATAGEGAGAGEAVVWICGPGRPCGLTAALLAALSGKPAEPVGATR